MPPQGRRRDQEAEKRRTGRRKGRGKRKRRRGEGEGGRAKATGVCPPPLFPLNNSCIVASLVLFSIPVDTLCLCVLYICPLDALPWSISFLFLQGGNPAQPKCWSTFHCFSLRGKAEAESSSGKLVSRHKMAFPYLLLSFSFLCGEVGSNLLSLSSFLSLRNVSY